MCVWCTLCACAVCGVCPLGPRQVPGAAIQWLWTAGGGSLALARAGTGLSLEGTWPRGPELSFREHRLRQAGCREPPPRNQSPRHERHQLPADKGFLLFLTFFFFFETAPNCCFSSSSGFLRTFTRAPQRVCAVAGGGDPRGRGLLQPPPSYKLGGAASAHRGAPRLPSTLRGAP